MNPDLSFSKACALFSISYGFSNFRTTKVYIAITHKNIHKQSRILSFLKRMASKKQLHWKDMSISSELLTSWYIPALALTWTKSSFCFIYLFFNWRIIALQNLFVFCQTATGISHRCSTYVPSLPSPSPPHPSRLIQSPCLSFLSHAADSHWLSVLHMVM